VLYIYYYLFSFQVKSQIQTAILRITSLVTWNKTTLSLHEPTFYTRILLLERIHSLIIPAVISVILWRLLYSLPINLFHNLESSMVLRYYYVFEQWNLWKFNVVVYNITYVLELWVLHVLEEFLIYFKSYTPH
jgi:hypothetical protein